MNNTVVVISNYAANYGGNFIRSIRALACACSGSVIFLFPEEARGKLWVEKLDGYEVEFVPFDRQGFHDACSSLVVRCGRDVLAHTHFVDGLLLAQVTECFDRVICHQHMALDRPSGLKGKTKAVLKKVLFGGIYSKALLVAVSEPVAASLRRAHPKARVECVPNAIDFSRYAGSVADAATRPLRIAARPRVRHALRAQGGRRSHERLRSPDQARQGCHSHSPRPQRGRMRQQGDCASGGVPRWMHIVPVTEDVPSFYSSHDLFLSPSRSEAFGYAAVEAAYMGCGVVASDVPGQNSLKGIDGIQWVRPNDPEDLANAMVASADLLSARTGNDLGALRASLESQYGIGRWIADMLKVYDSLR